MLTCADARGRRVPGFLAGLLIVVGVTLTSSPAAHAADPSPAPDLGDLPHGVTVSWPPTNKPVEIEPGTTASSSFWVTNDTARGVPIDIKPATAVPGEDGSLAVTDGADSRFPKITLVPSHFRAAPGSTTAVKETVVSPSDLPAGVYLLPAVVHPHDSRGSGNVRINRAIVGLTTFQVPGSVNVALSATLTPTDPPAGSLTRKLPGLPTIEIGRSAGATLGVTSHASGGFYAYYEVTGTTSGIGSLTLDGHAPGLPSDLRADQSLYFPGIRRDFSLSWTAGALTAARQTLTADVSFNPAPNRVQSVAASVTLISISPWWTAVALAVLLLVALTSIRRTARLSRAPAQRRRRAEKKPQGRMSQSIGRGLLALVALFAGSLAIYWLLAAAIVLVVIAIVLPWRASQGMDAADAVRRVVPANAVALALIVAGAVMLAMTLLRDASPGYSIALTSAAALCLLACDVLRRRFSLPVRTAEAAAA